MDNQDFLGKWEGDGSITISVGTRLVIENAVDFSKSISAALVIAQKVAVKFDGMIEMDITALQVLCSACKTAAAEGKIFTQQGPRPELMDHLIPAAGAECLGPCRYNTDNPCTWFGGKFQWQK